MAIEGRASGESHATTSHSKALRCTASALIGLGVAGASIGAIAWLIKWRRDELDRADLPQGLSKRWANALSRRQKWILRELENDGQWHVIGELAKRNPEDRAVRHFLAQLEQLDNRLEGGISGYVSRARGKLQESKDGGNPLEGWQVEIPPGENVHVGSANHMTVESEGVTEARKTAFVLVAGGVGERLGYSGAKVELPAELATRASFLQLYIESILALQAESRCTRPLPLAIMTSDDTHEAIRDLLNRNSCFGMETSQITLIKQDKVPCFDTPDGKLSLTETSENNLELLVKPHGHGDVHYLLHETELARKWYEEGLKWIAFFQDTNPLAFKAVPTSLGSSRRRLLASNSVAVPRKPKEAIGGIARLTSPDGTRMIGNVEYNVLDPLLRNSGWAQGDAADSSGYSPFPGNINQLVLSLNSYVQALDRTQGKVEEFANPKYSDASRTSFKKPARLECLMQDFPKSFPPEDLAGYTQLPAWSAYSPCKNSLEEAKGKDPPRSAASAEMDYYGYFCHCLKLLGADVPLPQRDTIRGSEIGLWLIVALHPSFAPTYGKLKERVNAPAVSMASGSALVVKGSGVYIDSLELKGALVIEAVEGASVTVRASVKNRGWQVQKLEDDDSNTGSASEQEKLRGFRIVRHEERRVVFDLPGDYLVEG